MIGEIINDKYKLEESISESHTYEVFSALEIETGVNVAIKILKEEMCVNAARVKTFTEEIQSFATLSHPNIAEILDIDMFEDRPFVVTELVEGKNLHSWIKEDIIPFSETIEVIRKLTAILQFAHVNKVEYRTIKLSNILRTAKKELTVLSFTFPRLRIAGTRSRVKSSKSGIQADLFFLGITLFEILTGETPIRRRGGINELWDNKLSRNMRIRHPDVDPEQMKQVSYFIAKTLTRNDSERFNSHEEFLKDLADIAVLLRKNTVKKRGQQLSMASQVVDALNGRMSNVNQAIPNIQQSSSFRATTTAPTSLKSEVKTQNKAEDFIIQDYAIEGSLALLPTAATNPDLNVLEPKQRQQKRPKLRLVKKNDTMKIKKLWRSEERHWLRNPVLFMGLCLTIMTLLVLFW